MGLVQLANDGGYRLVRSIDSDLEGIRASISPLLADSCPWQLSAKAQDWLLGSLPLPDALWVLEAEVVEGAMGYDSRLRDELTMRTTFLYRTSPSAPSQALSNRYRLQLRHYKTGREMCRLGINAMERSGVLAASLRLIGA